jgi:hypothetical protein
MRWFLGALALLAAPVAQAQTSTYTIPITVESGTGNGAIMWTTPYMTFGHNWRMSVRWNTTGDPLFALAGETGLTTLIIVDPIYGNYGDNGPPVGGTMTWRDNGFDYDLNLIFEPLNWNVPGLYFIDAFTALNIDAAWGPDVRPTSATVYLTANLGAVPEPAAWGMFILGFGAIGGAMRARARKIAFA